MPKIIYTQTCHRQAEVEVTEEELAVLMKGGVGSDPARQRVTDAAIIICADKPFEFASAICETEDGRELFDI